MQARSMVNAFFFLLLARVLSSLLLSFHHSLSSSHPCLGGFIRLSSSLTPNLGVVADGGGGRVRMVVAMVGGQLVPSCLYCSLSFLSLPMGGRGGPPQPRIAHRVHHRQSDLPDSSSSVLNRGGIIPDSVYLSGSTVAWCRCQRTQERKVRG